MSVGRLPLDLVERDLLSVVPRDGVFELGGVASVLKRFEQL